MTAESAGIRGRGAGAISESSYPGTLNREEKLPCQIWGQPPGQPKMDAANSQVGEQGPLLYTTSPGIKIARGQLFCELVLLSCF